MPKITREQVLKLALLSRLSLSEEEIQKYQDELSAILSYIERLDKVDVVGLNPTYQVTGLHNVMREDAVADQKATPEELLKLAPHTEGRYIKVKRMI